MSPAEADASLRRSRLDRECSCSGRLPKHCQPDRAGGGRAAGDTGEWRARLVCQEPQRLGWPRVDCECGQRPGDAGQPPFFVKVRARIVRKTWRDWHDHARVDAASEGRLRPGEADTSPTQSRLRESVFLPTPARNIPDERAENQLLEPDISGVRARDIGVRSVHRRRRQLAATGCQPLRAGHSDTQPRCAACSHLILSSA